MKTEEEVARQSEVLDAGSFDMEELAGELNWLTLRQ